MNTKDGEQFDSADFEGAKAFLFLGDKLAVILRDDKPGLSWAGHWDLPGGGREGKETPFACLHRECVEELGIQVAEDAVLWRRAFERGGVVNWTFVVRLPEREAAHVVFGDEGQRWALMTQEAFLKHPKAVPHFQERLRLYLDESRAE